MSCYKKLFLPTDEEESSGVGVRCRYLFFFLVMTGGLILPCWPCFLLWACLLLLLRLCWTKAVLLCCWVCSPPLLLRFASVTTPETHFSQNGFAKKISDPTLLAWYAFYGMHERIFTCSVGASWDLPRWMVLGSCGLSRIAMDAAGRGPVPGTHGCHWLHGPPSAKDTGDDLRVISSIYFKSFHFLHEKKGWIKVFWCGFHSSC